MNDKELARMIPAWAGWSKRKRDKVWKDYQEFSFSEEHEPEFKNLEKEADLMERERFLQLLPMHLEAKDHLSVVRLVDAVWRPVFEEGNEKEQAELALQVWDNANASIINALDTRDEMMASQLIEIIKGLVMFAGRAVRKLRKSPKFLPWMTFM